MGVDKIRVEGDPRVKKESATVNGRTYGYLLSQPESGRYQATVFLLHGFPDLSMGWRYQIPMLVDMGLRVVAPDCLGYGRTDAPDSHTEYGTKSLSDDIKALAEHLGESKIILGGHDWGAYLAYRVALWHPELISHLFTVCVPFTEPKKDFVPLEALVKGPAPSFTYQVQFASGDLEKEIQSKEQIKQFLTTLYGGLTPSGESAFVAEKGISMEKAMQAKPSRLMSEEELEYYATEFSRHGIHGPFNWYRTRKVNFDDDLSILGRGITIPTLFILALRDPAVPPQFAKYMDKLVPGVVIKEVDTSHWALIEKPAEVNSFISGWLNDVGFSHQSAEKL